MQTEEEQIELLCLGLEGLIVFDKKPSDVFLRKLYDERNGIHDFPSALYVVTEMVLMDQKLSDFERETTFLKFAGLCKYRCYPTDVYATLSHRESGTLFIDQNNRCKVNSGASHTHYWTKTELETDLRRFEEEKNYVMRLRTLRALMIMSCYCMSAQKDLQYFEEFYKYIEDKKLAISENIEQERRAILLDLAKKIVNLHFAVGEEKKCASNKHWTEDFLKAISVCRKHNIDLRKSSLLTDSSFRDYVDFSYKYKVQFLIAYVLDLENKNRELQQENEDLKTQILYMPGGEGMEEAKEEFESCFGGVDTGSERVIENSV